MVWLRGRHGLLLLAGLATGETAHFAISRSHTDATFPDLTVRAIVCRPCGASAANRRQPSRLWFEAQARSTPGLREIAGQPPGLV